MKNIHALNNTTSQHTFSILFYLILLVFTFCSPFLSQAQIKTYELEDFNKVTVSPHIEVTFKQGTQSKVVVESSTEPIEKLHVEVKKNTLNLYLEDAKIVTKNKKGTMNNGYYNSSIYSGTVIKATVYYKTIEDLSLRGKERFVFESPLATERIRFNIYGESQLYIRELHLKELKINSYGDSFLKIDSGTVENQKIVAYGESTVNTLNLSTESTKIIAYGSGSFQLNASKRLKVTSYGEATISYKGDADLNKGIIIGESTIVKL